MQYVMKTTSAINYFKNSFNIDKRMWLVYIVLFFAWGMLMDQFGRYMEIARFTHWWQVITTYLLFMVPIAILLRKQVWHMQYAYGLIAMSILEWLGYKLETSYAYPNNLLDQYFNIRNFSLSMAIFFAFYIPLGNWAVAGISRKLFNVK
jgi:uncharacterized membrane protein